MVEIITTNQYYKYINYRFHVASFFIIFLDNGSWADDDDNNRSTDFNLKSVINAKIRW